MTDLKEYEIDSPDSPGGKITVQLNDKDAEARGLKAKKAAAPADKAKKAVSNKKA